MAQLAMASKPRQLTILIVPVCLLILAFVTSVYSGPALIKDYEKCSSFCKESSKFVFSPGKKYVYDYQTTLSTSSLGSSTDKSTVHFNADVELTTYSACDIELKVTNVKLEESDPINLLKRHELPNSLDLIEIIESKSIRFSFQDGEIEHICTENSEPLWVLNIKRGILSALQNTMLTLSKAQTLYETDISGNCPTKYEASGIDSRIIVKKSKDLAKCSNRQSHISSIQSVPYTSSSPVQNIPLLSGSQECVQTVQNQKVIKTECKEIHKFHPFESSGSGVQTVVDQILEFKSETNPSSSIPAHLGSKISSLLFEAQNTGDAVEQDTSKIVSLLDALECETVPKVTSEAPDKFIELVHELKKINYQALNALFQKLGSTDKRKYFLDGIRLVGSAPALEFMVELYSKGQLDDDQIDSWLTSLSFIKHPDLMMISALEPLLDKSSRNQALLSVSSVIFAYCNNHENCNQEPPVYNTLRKLYTFLGNSCRAPSHVNEDVTRLIIILKAIANTGVFFPEHYKTIQKCFKDQSNPTEIRLAGLDIFRRVSCGRIEIEAHQNLIETYADMNENTEVRIHAYLMAIKCPDRELVDTVKDILYTDAVNQVSSFVWTHLTNLQETTSPDKQMFRELLSNDFLKSKFNTDGRKFSRNYEGAKFWEEQNIGTGYDANIIFAPDSFVPRSAMLNLTAHLFGESINLVEFGGRVHSLEQLLEPIFGPNGYFPDTTVKEALYSLRHKREVASQSNTLERLDSIYNQASLAANGNEYPGASFYTRIFGNEMMFKNFEIQQLAGTGFPTLIDEAGTNWLDITGLFENLSVGKSMDHSKSTMLLDSSYSVPTSAGIPITLGIQSGATVSMEASGKVDLSNYWENKEVDIHAKFKPSGAITVDGTMSVSLGDFYSKLQSGIRIQGKLHTSTAIEARTVIKNKQIFHASLTLPEDKQEIVSVKTQILLLRASGESKPISLPSDSAHSKSCTPELLSTVLGVQFCHETNSVHPSYLEPFDVSVYVEKTDTFQSYDFDYKWIENAEEGITDLSILFNTPGSKVDRRLAASFYYDSTLGKLEGSVESPSKSVNLESKYSDVQKSLQLTISSQNQQVLLLSAALRNPQGTRLEPYFLLSFYQSPMLEIQGAIGSFTWSNPEIKSTYELTIKHLTQTPVKINGEILRNGDAIDTNLSLESFLATGNIRSQIRTKRDLISVKSELQYSWKSKETKTYNIIGRVQNSKKGALTKYNTVLTATSGQNRDNNLDFSWEIQHALGYTEQLCRLSIGRSVYDGRYLYKNQLNRNGKDFHIVASLESPKTAVDYKLEFLHKRNDAGIVAKALGRIQRNQEVQGNVEYITKAGRLLQKNLNADINWPEHIYSFKSSLKEIKPKEYQGEVIIIPNKSTEKKASLSYKNGSTRTKVDHALELRARGFMNNPIFISSSIAASDRRSYLSGLLELEGEKDKRWSLNLDYNHVLKRSSHKLEGKVSVGEKKYTGEMSYKKTRAGDRTAIVDLQLSNHFYSEFNVKQVNSDTVAANLQIVPNLDNAPDQKALFESTLTSDTLHLKADYFGKKYGISGTYSAEKYEFTAEWDPSKQVTVFVNIPSFTINHANLVAGLDLPVNGYRNIGLSIKHVLDSNSMETNVQANVGVKTGSISLSGILTGEQSLGYIQIEYPEQEKIRGGYQFVVKKDSKFAQLTYETGVKKTVLEVQDESVLGGFQNKMSFTGCSFVPEVSTELIYKNAKNFETKFSINWNRNSKFLIDAVLNNEPREYKLSMSTPWDSLSMLDANLYSHKGLQTVRLDVKGELQYLPSKLAGRLHKKNENFEHSTEISWTENRQSKKINLSSKGYYQSYKSAQIETIIDIPDHRIHFDIHSKKDSKNDQSIEYSVDYDRNMASGGLHWVYEDEGRIISSGVWSQVQSHPRMTLSFEHRRNSQTFVLKGSANQGEHFSNEFLAELFFDGWNKWNVTTKLDSSLNMIPNIIFVSKHSMNGLQELVHSSSVLINTKSSKYFGAIKSPIKSSLDIILQNGKSIFASIVYNEDKINMDGQIIFESNSKKFDMQFISSLFESMQINGEWSTSPTYSVLLVANRLNQEILKLKLNAGIQNQTLSGSLYFNCPFGHELEGKVTFNMKSNELKLQIQEGRKSIVNLELAGLLSRNQGVCSVLLESTLHPFLEKIKADIDYQVEPNSLTLSGKYSGNQASESSLSIATFYLPNHVKFEVRFNNKEYLSFTSELLDESKLRTFLFYKETKVLEVTGQYRNLPEDYSMGKHQIDLQIIFEDSEPSDFSLTLGLDNEKFLIDLQSPFEVCKQLIISGKLRWLEGKKFIGFNFVWNEEAYNGGFELKKDKTSFLLNTPISGYSSVGFNMQYETSKTEKKLNLEIFLENQKLNFRSEYSINKIELLLQAPFEIMSNVGFIGAWNTEDGGRSQAEFRVQFNQFIYDAQLEWMFKNGVGIVNGNISGLEKGDFRMNYDFSKDYKVNASMEFSGKRHNLGFELNFGKDEVQIEFRSPFPKLANFFGKLQHSSSTPEHQLLILEWSINDKSGRILGEVKRLLDSMEFKLETPIYPWNSVIGKVEYGSNNSGSKFTTMKFERGDGKFIEAFIGAAVPDELFDSNKFQGDAGFDVKLKTPFKNLESLVLETAYARKGERKTWKMLFTLDSTIKAVGNVVLQNGLIGLDGDIVAPNFGLDQTSVTFSAGSNTNEGSSFACEILHNGLQYTSNGRLHLNPSGQWKMSGQTSFLSVKNLEIILDYSNKQKLVFVAEVNDQKAEMNLGYDLENHRHSKIVCEINTPFPGFKNIYAEVTASLQSTFGRLNFIFQNDRLRYMGKLEGTYSEDTGEIKLQINSPIYKMEQVLGTLKFNPEGIHIKLDRNTKEEFVFHVNLGERKIILDIASHFGTFPLSGNIALDWSSFYAPVVKVMLDAGSGKGKFTVRTMIEGFNSGNFKMQTPIKRYENFEAQWMLEGNLYDSGSASLETNLPFYGGNSARASWRNDKLTAANLEAWIKRSFDENEKGFSAQYSLSQFKNSNGKLGASISYILDKEAEQATLIISSKRSEPTSLLEITLKTPFQQMKEVTITSRFSLEPELTVDLSATHDQIKILSINSALSIDPASSKFKLSFNAPSICDSFNLNAVYDLIKIEKYVEIFFVQNQYKLNVKASATVPANPQEVELRMNVDSNIPSVTVSASGSVRAGYKIESDGNRIATVSIDSQHTGHWQVSGSYRPSPNFNAKFRLQSPIPMNVPPIKADLNWNTNEQNSLTGDMTVVFGSKETRSSLTVASDKFRLTFNSAFEGLKEFLVEGRIVPTDNFGKKMKIDIKLANEIISAEAQIPSESNPQLPLQSFIKLESSFGSIPDASLNLDLNDDGILEIIGKFGEHSLKVDGSFMKVKGYTSLLNAAESKISLILEGQELFEVHSHHLFHNDQYSLNFSSGDIYYFNSFAKLNNKQSLLSTSFQWENGNVVNMMADAEDERFSASLSTPWTSPMQLNGQYKVSSEEYSAKGDFTYDGVRSGLETRVLTSKDSFTSEIFVDVPILRQKLDCKINIQTPSKGNINGILELKLSDRQLSVTGVLTTKEYLSRTLKTKMEEKILQLTLSLPGYDYPEVKTDITIRKPTANIKNLEIDGALHLPTGSHKIMLRGQLPSQSSKQVSLDWYIDSEFLSANQFKGSVEAKHLTYKKFDISFRLKQNEVHLEWDLSSNYNIEAYFHIPSISGSSAPFKIQANGLFYPKTSMTVNIALSYYRNDASLQGSLTRTSKGAELTLYIESPQLLLEPKEMNVKFTKLDSSRYVYEISGVSGKQSVTLTSEFTQLENIISFSSKLSGSYGIHFIEITGTKIRDSYEVECGIESLSLLNGKKVSVTGKFQPLSNQRGFVSNIECRTKKYLHSMHLTMDLQPTTGNIFFKLTSPTLEPLLINGHYDLTKDKGRVKGTGIFQRQSHSFEVTFNRKELEGKIHINSPFIPSNVATLHFKTLTKKNNVSLIGDLNINQSRWRFESTVIYDHLQNMEAKLEFITPFQSLDRITLSGKLTSDQVRMEIYTPIKEIPNCIFDLSGIPLYEPINYNNFHPKLVIGLPYTTLITSGSVQHPDVEIPGKFGLMFEQKYRDEEGIRYLVEANISPMKRLSFDMEKPLEVRFIAESPLEGYEHLECIFGGNIQWKNWAEIKATLGFNDEKINLVSQLRNDAGSRKFVMELTTPFNSYKRYGFAVHIDDFEEIGAGQNIWLEFQLPNWNDPFTVELEYRLRYNGFLNMDGELKLAAPMTSIPPIILSLKSEGRSSMYSGLISGNWGDQRPIISLEAGMTGETFYSKFEAKGGVDNEYQALINFEAIKKQNKFSLSTEVQNNYLQILSLTLGLSEEHNMIEGEARIKTSSPALRTSSVIFRLSPISSTRESLTFYDIATHLDMTVGFSYNSKKIVHLEIVNKDGKRAFEIHNPYQPISISVKYDKENEQRYNVETEFCWNLAKPLVNSIGFKISFSNSDLGNYGTILKVQIPGKGYIELIFDKIQSSDTSGQNLKLTWNTGEIGYNVQYKDVSSSGQRKYVTLINLNLPWRTIEVESTSVISPKLSSTSFDLKWDAKNFPNKRLGAKLVEERHTEWRSHTVKKTLTLKHSGLRNDIVISSKKHYKQGVLQGLELIFSPNQYPQDQLRFQFARDGLQNNHVQINLSHPSTNLDANFNLQQSDSTVSIIISFMDILGQKNVLSLEGTQDELGMVLDVQCGVDTELSQILQVEFKEQEEQHTLSIKSSFFELNGEIHNFLPHVKCSLKYGFDIGDTREIYIMAGLPHKREIALKLSRNENGMDIKDLLMSVKLNTSRLISTHLHWRPELLEDIQEFGNTQIPIWISNVKDLHIPKILSYLNEEVESRLAVIDPGLSRTWNEWIHYTEEEMTIVKDDLIKTFQKANELYQKNFLYCKDIVRILKDAFGKLWGQGSSLVGKLPNLAKQIPKTFSLIKEIMIDYARHLDNYISSLWENFEQVVTKIWKEYVKWFDEVSSNITKIYLSIAKILNGNLDELGKKLKAMTVLPKIQRLYNDYIGILDELPGQKYISEARNWVRRNIWIPIERYCKPYGIKIKQAIEERNIIALLDMPPLPYFRYAAQKFISATQGLWKLIEAEQRVKELLQGILNKLDHIVQRNVPTATMIWETEKGNIEYHQPLRLFQWEDFTEFPELQKSPEDRADVKHITEFYYSLLDTIRETRPYLELNMREILPPFGATATMAGDYHYLTFDKKYFRFAGECSYVLIADLLHQNFTLVANYEARGNVAYKKSYSLVTDDRVIEISADNFETTIDGRKTELPVQVGPTFLRREPSGLEIFDSRGFQMKCTLNPKVCHLAVSGWYFGKLGGLLGTYDHEVSNDFRTPDGQTLNDIANFAHSWRVGRNGESNGKQCRMKNYAVADSTSDFDVDTMCSDLFASRSSLYRPCFPVVDPKVYMEMCKHDVSRHKSNVERNERVCNSVGAYVLECQRNGIDMWMSPACVKCHLEDGSTIRSGENVTLSVGGPNLPPSSGDIIFLIEEISSLKDYNLNEAISKLDSSLDENGITDNRYAVVGFGGKGPRDVPHIRTSSGQVWSHNTAIRIPSNVDMDGSGTGNLYNAIQYAANIGYRVGVSKTIIAVVGDISSCGNEEGYGDALTLLMENDFKFHILTPQDFSMKVTKKQGEASRILGVNLTDVYTTTHGFGDQALRRYVKVSKDLCTPLALETSGTMFNLKHLNQPQTSHKFLEVWSKRVASNTKPSGCQRCECLPHRDGGALQLCQPCISPALQKFIDDFNKLDVDGDFKDAFDMEPPEPELFD